MNWFYSVLLLVVRADTRSGLTWLDGHPLHFITLLLYFIQNPGTKEEE